MQTCRYVTAAVAGGNAALSTVVERDEAVEYVQQFLARAGLSDTYDVFESCERHMAADLRLGYTPGEWWQAITDDEVVWACRVSSSDSNEVATVVIAPPSFGNPLPEPKLSRGFIGGKVLQRGEAPWRMYGGPPPPHGVQ